MFLFVIHVNLLHPQPSLFLCGLLLCLWCFSTFVKHHFQVSFNLKVNLSMVKIPQKYRDRAPLTYFNGIGALLLNRRSDNMDSQSFTTGAKVLKYCSCSHSISATCKLTQELLEGLFYGQW